MNIFKKIWRIIECPTDIELSIMSIAVIIFTTWGMAAILGSVPLKWLSVSLFAIAWFFYSKHGVKAGSYAYLLFFGSRKRKIGDGEHLLPVFLPFLHKWWVVWPYDLDRLDGEEFKNVYSPFQKKSSLGLGDILMVNLNRSKDTQNQTIWKNFILGVMRDLGDHSNRRMVYHNIGTIFFISFMIVVIPTKALGYFGFFVPTHIEFSDKCVILHKDQETELLIKSPVTKGTLAGDEEVVKVGMFWNTKESFAKAVYVNANDFPITLMITPKLGGKICP